MGSAEELASSTTSSTGGAGAPAYRLQWPGPRPSLKLADMPRLASMGGQYRPWFPEFDTTGVVVGVGPMRAAGEAALACGGALVACGVVADVRVSTLHACSPGG